MFLSKLQEDLKTAMKTHDETKTLVIRSLLSSINYARIDKQHDLSDLEVEEVLSKEVKKHKESIEMFKKGNRQDLWEKEEKELAIILSYLPKQMSEEEVREEINKILAVLSEADRSNFGKAMSFCMPKLKGRADGQIVAGTLKDILGENQTA
jgi:uncharacterized protein YqeY